MTARANRTIEEVFRRYLRPYQRRLIEDRHPRVICLKSRRIGMSEAVCILAILLAKDRPYDDVYLCSTSYTNAKELLRRVGRWVEAFERAGIDLGIVSVKKTEIEFANGSRIIPMPAMAVRGRTGSIILDEFAFYQHDREVWAGVAPVADTDPNLRVVLISTPFGASGMFHEIWSDPNGEHGEWSRHFVDVYQAAEEGFPVDPEKLQAKYPRDIWLQEFCGQFLSDINQYFSFDLIRRSQWSPEDLPGGLFPGGRRLAGIDLASTQDASCFADATDTATAFWVRLVHTIKAAGTSMDYTPQFQEITRLLQASPFDGVCVDGTGEGKQLAQDLKREFGYGLVTSVDSKTAWSQVYGCIPQIRLEMEQGTFKLPNDPKVRAAFTKIQRLQTTAGSVKFDATRDVDGHADEFFACLFAYAKARAFGPAQTKETPEVVAHMGSMARDYLDY